MEWKWRQKSNKAADRGWQRFTKRGGKEKREEGNLAFFLVIFLLGGEKNCFCGVL
jgi:hypothetical protein